MFNTETQDRADNSTWKTNENDGSLYYSLDTNRQIMELAAKVFSLPLSQIDKSFN